MQGSNVVPEVTAAYFGASNGDLPEHYDVFVGAMESVDVKAHQCRMIKSFVTSEDIEFVRTASILLLAGGDVDVGELE